MLGSGSVSAGAGFTQNLCGDFLLGIRTLLADIHLDRVFAALGMGVIIRIVSAIGPAGPGIIRGISAVIGRNMVAAPGYTGRDDGANEDHCKQQSQ